MGIAGIWEETHGQWDQARDEYGVGTGGKDHLPASVRRSLSLGCGIHLEMDHGFPRRRLTWLEIQLIGKMAHGKGEQILAPGIPGLGLCYELPFPQSPLFFPSSIQPGENSLWNL